MLHCLERRKVLIKNSSEGGYCLGAACRGLESSFPNLSDGYALQVQATVNPSTVSHSHYHVRNVVKKYK